MPKKQSSSKHEASKVPKPTPTMTSKTVIVVNPLQSPCIDIEHVPLADVDYKIAYPIVEFNLLDIHNWCYENSLDDQESIHILESHLPKYVFPLTHPC